MPLEALKTVERVKGIEPSLSAWEADNEIITFGLTSNVKDGYSRSRS
jgi:hypothetical protein